MRVDLGLKIHKTKEEAQAAAVDAAVNSLIEKALARGASDVHIEPRARNIVVRFRVDGWLQETGKLPLAALDGIMQNLKKRAGMDANERSAPQSGSFQLDSNQIAASVRVATMPTITGEKVVLHLVRHLGEPATLEALGFWGESLRRLEAASAEPHGLIVAAGLHRTGGTMSLLGLVHLLNNPALNVATLEETVEQRIAGIAQTQVSSAAGVNFSTGLQALLKQDPNVVMVSDLGESDTVRVAVQAALGGRLILGGLHASDAANGIKHLLSMHTEPFLVASALRAAIGQRFVRRLCMSCRVAYEPDESTRKSLRALLRAGGIKSVKELHELERTAIAAGLGDEADDTSTTEKSITRLFRASHEGCPRCRFRGLSGQLGLNEVLIPSDAMKKLLVSNPAAASVRKLAVEEGMLPMACDGLIKALRGLTSLEEISPLAAAA